MVTSLIAKNMILNFAPASFVDFWRVLWRNLIRAKVCVIESRMASCYPPHILHYCWYNRVLIQQSVISFRLQTSFVWITATYDYDTVAAAV